MKKHENQAVLFEAVQTIKTAILKSQGDAARSVNEKQLLLYFGVGKYISLNSRSGFWGKGAIDAISSQLGREMPGLKGFSSRNLRNMRTFYEEWALLAGDKQEQISSKNLSGKAELQIWQTRLPNSDIFSRNEFFNISFSHHTLILSKIKNYDERIFYIRLAAAEKLSHDELKIRIILCKDMNKSFVDFVIRDYTKPMGVATYKTSKDMPDKLKKALPDIDDLRKLLESNEKKEG